MRELHGGVGFDLVWGTGRSGNVALSCQCIMGVGIMGALGLISVNSGMQHVNWHCLAVQVIKISMLVASGGLSGRLAGRCRSTSKV